MSEDKSDTAPDHEDVHDTPAEDEFQFQTVGERLKEARSDKGLSLEDIAAKTRIPQRHLESLESANYDALPGRTYAVGFAKAYARNVDLSETEIASDLKDEMGAVAGDEYRHQNKTPYELEDPSKIPSSKLAWIAAIVGLVLLVGGFGIWRTFFFPEPDYVLLDEEPEGEAMSGAEKQAAATTDSASQPSADGEVVFIAKEEGIWVRFYEADGERLYENTMKLGDKFVLPKDAVNPLVLTGRPDALAITIDGKTVPPLSDSADRPVNDMPVSAQALLARTTQNSADESAGDTPAGGT